MDTPQSGNGGPMQSYLCKRHSPLIPSPVEAPRRGGEAVLLSSIPRLPATLAPSLCGEVPLRSGPKGTLTIPQHSLCFKNLQ